MAKKELNEDLLAGGSLSSKDKKAGKEVKKAEKQAAKQKAVAEKNNAKRAAIKKQLDELKEKKQSETDAKKLEAINNDIKKLSAKYSAVGGSSKGISKQTQKIIKIAVCVVLVVAILAAYVCTGYVRKGLVAYTGLPAKTLTAVTVSNGDDSYKVTVDTYNFYFARQYNYISNLQSSYKQNNYPIPENLNVDLTQTLSSQTYTDEEGNTMSWDKHIQDMVVESIEYTYTYYLAALKANDGKEPQITDDQKAELQESLDSYQEQATKYGYTISGYLTLAMGRGVTEDVFVRETTRQYISQNYAESLSDSSNRDYTADDIKAYKDANIDSFTTVDVKIFECSSEDDAKAFRKALKADGSNFAALCAKYAESDFDKKAYKEEERYSTIIGATKSTIMSGGYAIGTAEEHEHKEGETEEHKYPGLDWLFSKKRQAGDIRQDSTTVVYVISPASVSDRNTINVRHILIQPNPEADDQSTASESEWKAAKKKADKILKQWTGGKRTEDSFSKLAEENSDDGSKDNGGLYENVYTGQMVNPFSAWCFDENRKSGDTGIVRTQFGYHIMYFVGENDQKVWEYNAEQSLASEDASSDAEKLEKDYTAKVSWFGSRYFIKDVDISH